jgi:uncharacterized cofD-like protein
VKKIVIFGGGSGPRSLTLALCGSGCALTRVVPAWDSGGSSSALRQALGILPVGDIRQALMTLAHGEGRAGNLIKFFNARLSEDAGAGLRDEFELYAHPAHPLLQAIEPEVRAAILEFLRIFRSRIAGEFDFRRGSIGNFVLAGAYFACGDDINQAILEFRKLCAIAGQVWPSSVEALDLSGELRDGTRIVGQHLLTSLLPQQARVGIRKVHLEATHPARGAPAGSGRANPAALAAIAAADLFVFGPGSFFTSILPHLLVPGVARAILDGNPGAPRVLIGNILECPETTGRDLAELVGAFEQLATGSTGATRFLTHVIANRRPLPVRTVLNGFAYLRSGELESAGVTVMEQDLEDAWNQGRHDAQALAQLVLQLE